MSHATAAIPVLPFTSSLLSCSEQSFGAAPMDTAVIAHELDISAGTVSSIIHSVLMTSKVSSRWVPIMLNPRQKACCQKFSEENLDMLRANPENLFSRIITGDETRVHHHDPETKRVHAMKTINRKDDGKNFLGHRRCSAFGI